jgi:hypothetical protein
MTPSPRRLKDQVQETVSELPVHAARLAVMGVGQALLLTDRVRKDYKEARESGLAPVLGRLIDDAENLTGRLVGKVTSRVVPDGRTSAEESAAPTATGPEIAVGKPAAASRTRPATARPKPPTPSPAAPKGRTAAPSRAKGTTPSSRPATDRAGTKPAKPAGSSRNTGAAGAGLAEPAAAKPTPPAAATKPPATRKPPARKTATPAKAPAPPKETPTAAAPGGGTTTGADLPIADYDHATIASVRARLRTLNARQVNELRDYERAHAARAEFLRMFENRIAKLRGQA